MYYEKCARNIDNFAGSCRTDQHEMTCRGKNSLHDLKKVCSFSDAPKLKPFDGTLIPSQKI